MAVWLLALYRHEEILQKSSSLKLQSDFEIISQNCSLSDFSQRLYMKFLYVNKHGSSEWGLLAQ